MNNKDFVGSLARKTDIDEEQCAQLIDSFVEMLASSLCEGKTVSVQGVGNFEQKRKAERKIYNPASKEFKVVPSKVVANFKMSPVLKEKVNNP